MASLLAWEVTTGASGARWSAQGFRKRTESWFISQRPVVCEGRLFDLLLTVQGLHKKFGSWRV